MVTSFRGSFFALTVSKEKSRTKVSENLRRSKLFFGRSFTGFSHFLVSGRINDLTNRFWCAIERLNTSIRNTPQVVHNPKLFSSRNHSFSHSCSRQDRVHPSLFRSTTNTVLNQSLLLRYRVHTHHHSYHTPFFRVKQPFVYSPRFQCTARPLVPVPINHQVRRYAITSIALSNVRTPQFVPHPKLFASSKH